MEMFTLVYLILASMMLSVETIHDKLHYFETLKADDFSHRVRRSADPDPNSRSHLTELEFSALGRQFHLFLKPSTILSRNFKGVVVQKQGKSEPFHIRGNSVLSGTLAGDSSSIANVNFEDKRAILANIVTKDNTYIIEPSWRHLPHSNNHTMVIYRQSDMKREFPNSNLPLHKTCGIKEGVGYEDPELHGRINVDMWSESGHSRQKRQSAYLNDRMTCEIMVVADYRFFDYMGGKSVSNTALYMITVIGFVNNIYRRTEFENGVKGINFEIGEMRIHNSSHHRASTLQSRSHYNRQTDYWDNKDLLESFSADKYFTRFCLAHLFTYRQFDDGVLGLAYIASPRYSAVGGICSPTYPKYPGVKLTLNTGWTSSQNSRGDRVLSLQANLVTTHEFGHNLGSEHDPETADCAPSKDGKYIMYPWAVSGYDRNNNKFSPCSKNYIFQVLKVKGYNCFIVGKGEVGICGNGRIDKGEECDGGWASKEGTDPCCDSNCKLYPGKICSPMNFPCCSELCQPSSTDSVCRRATNATCHDEIKCNGINITCPNITSNKPDKTPCIDQGICQDGVCLDFCKIFSPHLEPCICPVETKKSCHRCCKPSGGVCSSINNTLLPDGRPCYQGLCNQGVCEKKQQELIQRIFDIIEDISIDQLVAFMRSNIVGTVIVLSLVLWIPASCVVSYVDKKNLRKEKAKRNWMSRSNRTLYLEDDRARIRTVVNPRISRQIQGGSVVRPRDSAEPSVRWPEASWEQPAFHPKALKPLKFPGIGPSSNMGATNNFEAYDITPDRERDREHETVV